MTLYARVFYLREINKMKKDKVNKDDIKVYKKPKKHSIEALDELVAQINEAEEIGFIPVEEVMNIDGTINKTKVANFINKEK